MGRDLNARIEDWANLQQNHRTKELMEAIEAGATKIATEVRQVSESTPEPDYHLLALWDKRTRALEKYRQGKQKKHLDKVNRLMEEASKYANVLSIGRWLGYCESFDEKTNLRDVWKTFKSMSGKKKGVSPVPVIALLSNEKTEKILNKLGDIFFPQPLTKPEAIIYHPTHSGPADKLEDLPFTEWELGAAIQQCRSKSAPGDDGITVPMLRNAPLATRLVILKWFNEIWESGQLPEE
ncbi:hypothetical protein HPB47_027262 [Ixodes persulcatus]|uniref:Uncharacterized protein n=1 Tax=Ixodes persulcatus TaxID=34615 RepID=A0AC60PYE9_IXOPE|nr:hypothetical protein HPB47_027262 [Ixodes persulcatus]